MKRPNGSGTVYKDGGSWVIQITQGYNENGKPIRKKKRGFKTKKEAFAHLEALKKETDKVSIDALWQTYLKTDYKKLSESKQRHYETVYKRLAPIRSSHIDDITILDLQNLIEPYTSYYAQRDIKTVMSHLYNIAIAQRFCTTNLTPYMQLTDHEEKEGVTWTDDELQKFWSGYENGDKFCGYILFMSYTGTMPGELRTIQKQMVDYDTCEIRGAGLKTDIRKSAPILIPDRIIPILQDLLADRTCLWDKTKSKFYSEYESCLARLNVEYKPPYTCRHTAATMLANETDALITQKIMRHAQITTTQRYVHPSSETLLKAINKL